MITTGKADGVGVGVDVGAGVGVDVGAGVGVDVGAGVGVESSPQAIPRINPKASMPASSRRWDVIDLVTRISSAIPDLLSES